MALTAKERRELYRKESEKRHRESYDSRNDSGKFRSIWDVEKRSEALFANLKTEETHALYMIPFTTGENHPKGPGKMAIVLDLFVHRGIGINKDSFVCLNRTYGKKCAVCEYQSEIEETVDEKAYKAFSPTRRSIYNVVITSNPTEEKKGVQILDVPQYSFTLPLENYAHKRKGGGEVAYADIDKGKIISFCKSGVKRDTKYDSWEFEDRPDIPDEILIGAYTLDEFVHVPTYEEVYAALHPEEETETSPKREIEKEKKEEKKPEQNKLGKEKETSLHVECVYGASFGTDYNEYEECLNCEARESCRNKKDELDEEEKKKQTKPPERKKLVRREK